MAEQDICPHVDSIGEITKEDLLLKAKVGLFPSPQLILFSHRKIVSVLVVCILFHHILHIASVTRLLCDYVTCVTVMVGCLQNAVQNI